LDFFNNTHVRRAFAYSFNWSTYGEQAFYGEYDYRKNWLVAGLYPDYYNGSIPGYYESLSAAEAELKAAIIDGQNVWNSGFNFTVGYVPGNDPRRIAFTMISDFFKRLSTYDNRNGPSFTVNVQAIPNVVSDFRNRLRPICVIGWLVDFADADDFARPYMWSGIFGGFAPGQGYTGENGWGSTKDVLVDQAVLTVDGPVREAIYQELQQIYYDDVPSFPLPTSCVRRWQQYWVKGWYCNPMYYGLMYFYPIWKSDDCWFDVSGPLHGVSDGVVNMRDIAYLVDHFNAKPPIAGQTIGPKWVGVYGANGCVDPSGDRVCNLRDIAGCIQHFNHKINTNTP
jgi:peptide/nickel transport system substrate-binding protein